MLSYEEVNSILNYDKDTGSITWKKNRKESWIGKFAGSYTSAGYHELNLQKNSKRNRLLGHRVAWLLTHKRWPEKHIDHINGDKADNRIANLREVDNQENHKNMKRHVGNKSGHTGIYWSKACSKWQAYICIDSKQTYLGVFDDLDDAVQVRKDAEISAQFHKNHGRT